MDEWLRGYGEHFSYSAQEEGTGLPLRFYFSETNGAFTIVRLSSITMYDPHSCVVLAGTGLRKLQKRAAN
jgi:hypothetical protein